LLHYRQKIVKLCVCVMSSGLSDHIFALKCLPHYVR